MIEAIHRHLADYSRLSHQQQLLIRESEGVRDKTHQKIASLERALGLAWDRANKIAEPTPTATGYTVVGLDGLRHTWTVKAV